MTDTQPSVADAWASRAAPWLTFGALAATIAVGRWMTGPTFGYPLFALAWVPVAVLFVPPDGRRLTLAGRWPQVALLALSSLPLWTDDRLGVAMSLQTILLAAVAVTVAWHALASRVGLIISGRAVVVLCWLTWMAAPLVMADRLSAAVGDPALAGVLGSHPVLAANAAAERAGDWTHQAVAYRWLTRLGQDVAFELPASATRMILLHTGFAALALLLLGIVQWVVDRFRTVRVGR